MVFLFTICLLTGSTPGLPASDRSFSPHTSYSPDDTLMRPEELYSKAMLISQYLFNGPRYHLYDRTAETHQFYKTRTPIQGSLLYDGQNYGPFEMLYDVHFDQLVIRHPSNGFLIRLDPAKVRQFTLNGDYFQLLDGRPELNKGIYQTIYNGSSKLICRRKKIKTEKIVDFKTTTVFHNADAFFLYAGERYIRIRRKKDLYHLFPDHKNELRAYFRSEYTSFKGNIEKHLLNVVKIIDQPGSGA